jgi:hypothetical protein
MLVREAIGRAKVEGDIGLELEVEAKRPLPVFREGTWIAKHDGSLRGLGMEYVTNGPIAADHTKRTKLDELIAAIEPSKPDHESPRTSFHVHVNVREHTLTEMYTAACCYWLVDNLMTRYCGPDREGNVFCLRLKDAEQVIKSITLGLHDTVRPFRQFDNRIRYASQNLAAVPLHGTLEYRNMRGTLDPAIMDRWSTALYKLVNRAKEYKRPDILMDTVYEDKGYRNFLRNLFGWDFAYDLMQGDYADMIEENVGIVMELAYSQDWDKWEKRIDKNLKPQVMPEGIQVHANDDGMGLRWADALVPAADGQERFENLARAVRAGNAGRNPR